MPSDEQLLRWDPFADDKDDGGVTQRSKRIVRTRKRHVCSESFNPDRGGEHFIEVGQRALVFEGVGDDGWLRFYTCIACITAYRDEEEVRDAE